MKQTRHTFDPPVETLEELSAAIEELRSKYDDASRVTVKASVSFRGLLRTLETTEADS